MWMRFPDGVDQINIELQNFVTEIEQEGHKFFRVPDHFAPTILSLPGFAAERPKGDDVPDDLPPTVPGAAGAMDDLSSQISALKNEVAGLKAIITDLTTERDKAVRALDQALRDKDAAAKALADAKKAA